jgi:hypothetical protein
VFARDHASHRYERGAASSRSVVTASPTASMGKPRSRHASKPPANGRTRLMPARFSWSATRALVASFGQLQ